jgi:hypothetical protein
VGRDARKGRSGASPGLVFTGSGLGYTSSSPMLWFSIWFLVILKIPIAYLGYVIWWAVKDPPEPSAGPNYGPAATSGDGGGGVGGARTRRVPPRPIPGRRPGPHGVPARRPVPVHAHERTRAS